MRVFTTPACLTLCGYGYLLTLSGGDFLASGRWQCRGWGSSDGRAEEASGHPCFVSLTEKGGHILFR